MKKYDIHNILKKLRIDNNLSVDSVSEKLKKYNINIKPKTIYNYENKISMPNADIFLALCEIYNCIDIFNTFGMKDNKVIQSKKSKKEDIYLTNYKKLNPERKKRIDKFIKIELNEQKDEELKNTSETFLKA